MTQQLRGPAGVPEPGPTSCRHHHGHVGGGYDRHRVRAVTRRRRAGHDQVEAVWRRKVAPLVVVVPLGGLDDHLRSPAGAKAARNGFLSHDGPAIGLDHQRPLAKVCCGTREADADVGRRSPRVAATTSTDRTPSLPATRLACARA